MTATETDETATSTNGGNRPKPTFAAEAVDQIPESLNLRKGGPKGTRVDPAFTAAVEQAAQNPGQTFCVATYQSRDGAKNLEKKIIAGKIKLPKGEWDVNSARVEGPGHTDENPVVWSKLYVQLLVNADANAE